jgi:hypothetical protein
MGSCSLFSSLRFQPTQNRGMGGTEAKSARPEFAQLVPTPWEYHISSGAYPWGFIPNLGVGHPLDGGTIRDVME